MPIGRGSVNTTEESSIGDANVPPAFFHQNRTLSPRTATEARVHHVQSIRWLLYPRAQILVWLTASTVVIAPILHLLLFLPDTFTSNDLINGPSHAYAPE
ncbi:hypothetical protein H257_17095 [Aphanomyces astaci]|uniref:Uncharacterized protein n=1 Tax=Aphanomyces astaci TaxID=112090 RepID=W4FI50_APHAT|nr:hypothetical protein H257_17095 [Aphanomyces astaci]ETV66428.1 hypothetical protein H257_17095 [Aphanomyces astaci]|eukprot:XP_009844062.1 hypothetical protein H257_17095 [Aphanomyces astaci]